MNKITYSLLTAFLILLPSAAIAGDGATLVFREGHVAYVNDGYQKIADAYKTSGASREPKILEMSLNGGNFLINLSDVVIVCRDHCVGLDITDPRRTYRGSQTASSN